MFFPHKSVFLFEFSYKVVYIVVHVVYTADVECKYNAKQNKSIWYSTSLMCSRIISQRLVFLMYVVTHTQ